MIWKIIQITIICCLAMPAFSQGALERDIDRLTSGLAIEEKRVNDRETVDFRNEITMLLTASYHFYKAFISSQDANNCAFHPSCSTYALETIRLNGLLGIFDAIDRLTRCNGFSPDKYQIHDESQHFHDPVKKIH